MTALATPIDLDVDDVDDIEDDEDDRSYSYDQLSDAAKQTAREWYVQQEWDDGTNCDRISEMFDDELEHVGFSTKDVYWSFHYGASVKFHGSFDPRAFLAMMDESRISYAKVKAEERKGCILDDADIAQFETTLRRYMPAQELADLTFSVDLSNHNSNAYMISSVELYFCRSEDDLTPRQRLELRNLERSRETIEAAYETFLKAIEERLVQMGRDEIEYLESDEYAEEGIEGNSYEFDRDGNFSA